MDMKLVESGMVTVACPGAPCLLSDCGHWTQQECAAEVNAAMLESLKAL
jgi:hypothetical protein